MSKRTLAISLPTRTNGSSLAYVPHCHLTGYGDVYDFVTNECHPTYKLDDFRSRNRSSIA